MNLTDKTVLVTGGTGSFGQMFAKTILGRYRPKRLIVFSRDELKQSEMARDLSDPCLRYFIGDIRDLERLRRALQGVASIASTQAIAIRWEEPGDGPNRARGAPQTVRNHEPVSRINFGHRRRGIEPCTRDRHRADPALWLLHCLVRRIDRRYRRGIAVDAPDPAQ